MTTDDLIRVIEREADQLDYWATECTTGGWSAHHVNAMRERAMELRRIAARARREATPEAAVEAMHRFGDAIRDATALGVRW